MKEEEEDPWEFLEKELQEFEKAMKALEEVADSDSTLTNSPPRQELDSKESSSGDITSLEAQSGAINRQESKEKPQPPPKPKMLLTQDGRLKPVPPPRPTKALQQ
jgi:hypothetical protein